MFNISGRLRFFAARQGSLPTQHAQEAGQAGAPPPQPSGAADRPSVTRRASTLSRLLHFPGLARTSTRGPGLPSAPSSRSPAPPEAPPLLPPLEIGTGRFANEVFEKVGVIPAEIEAPAQDAIETASQHEAEAAGGPQARDGAPGPVFNADGSIDAGRFRSVATRLADSMPAREALPGKQARREWTKLRNALQDMAGLQATGGHAETGILLRARDQAAAASEHARRIAQALGNVLSKRPGARQERAELAATFACMAALLNEIKRIHLTAAAPAVMREHAEREARHLKEQLPSITIHSNSQAYKEANVGLGYDAGVAGGTLSGRRSKIVLFDDDRDMNFWTATGGTLSAGPSAWVASLSGSVGAEAGGVYFETETLEDLNALVANRAANRAWLSRSASPRARTAQRAWRRALNRIATVAGGRLAVTDARLPLYLSDSKLEKGFSPAALHRLAAEFGLLTGDASIRGEVEAAYPAPVDRLRDPDSAARYREPLGATVPLSDPLGDGKAPFRDYQSALALSFGRSEGLETGAAAGAALSVSARANVAQFHLRNVEPAHRLLDPQYHADMAQTLFLHKQVQDAAEREPGGRFRAWQQVRQALGHDAELALAPEDETYFGSREEIPSQFRDSIVTTDTQSLRQRLGVISAMCGQMRERYLAFVRDAAVVAVKTGKTLPGTVRAELEAARLQAAAGIEQHAWGGASGSEAAGYPGGAAAALKDPATFISATHDALGMALACAGTHLAIVKRRLVQLVPADDPRRDDIAAAMQEADDRYAEVMDLMNKAFLPLKREQVFLRSGSFQDKGLSRRYNLNLFLTGGGGVTLNAAAAIPSLARAGEIAYEVGNAAGQASLTVRCRYQYADHQINPSRQGHFLEFRMLAFAGQPLTGYLLVEGMMRALQRLHPDIDPVRQRASLREQLHGMAWEAGSEAGIVIRLRRFPGSDAGFLLQFVRVLEIKRSGPRLSVTAGSPFGVFRARWSRLDVLQNVVEEVLGPDIGYLVLQHGKLMRLLAGVEDRGGGNAGLAAAFREDAEGRVIARSYFGNSSAIPTVLDSYRVYRERMEQPDAGQAPTQRAANEFFRYFERDTGEEPMRRVALLAREARHFSPGARAADPFRIPAPAHEPVPLPDVVRGAAWDEEQAHIRARSSLDERIAYYCSERGRPLLDAFVRIIGVTKEVHNASRHRTVATRYGFQTALADRKRRIAR